MTNLSYFSLTTERLVEVFWEHNNCNLHKSVIMMCTRFIANNRFSDTSFIENNHINEDYESSSDDEMDIYLSKHILSTTIIENDSSNKQYMYEKDKEKIIAVLENIGLVIKDDSNMDELRILTLLLKPSKLLHYKHNITSYNPNRNFLSSITEVVKHDLVNCSSSDKYNAKRKYYTSTPLSSPNQTPSPCNTTNEYRNYHNSVIKNYGRSKNNEQKKLFFNRNEKISLKYWSKRHMLFSKFDLGILLDNESFYSVCPEVLSYHIAKRCQNNVVLDPFCGAGGNIIQLAFTCNLVIAIDIDPKKITFAKHNAEIYGVAEKIEFIVGDFFTLAPDLKADVVFMSPPWGGPDYSVNESFSIDSMCAHHFGGGYGIFKLVKNIAPNIAFHLPKTTNIYECLWLAKSLGKLEIQQNIINDRLNSITAFYGEFTNITDDDY